MNYDIIINIAFSIDEKKEKCGVRFKKNVNYIAKKGVTILTC